MSESRPDLAKIMARPFKVAADEELQTLSSPFRKQQHGQDGDAEQDNKGRDRKTGGPAKAGNDLSRYSDNKKISSGQ